MVFKSVFTIRVHVIIASVFTTNVHVTQLSSYNLESHASTDKSPKSGIASIANATVPLPVATPGKTPGNN
jgi:hypothetical protein